MLSRECLLFCQDRFGKYCSIPYLKEKNLEHKNLQFCQIQQIIFSSNMGISRFWETLTIVFHMDGFVYTEKMKNIYTIHVLIGLSLAYDDTYFHMSTFKVFWSILHF